MTSVPRRIALFLAAALCALTLGATALAPSASAWLASGSHKQYPSSGGVWEYGFWNAKVRSYYTVNRCHGSTVALNGSAARSVNTASGHKSIAEKWAVNYWGADDQYYYRTC